MKEVESFSYLIDVDHTQRAERELFAFHATFICVGLMTSASAWIFWQLSPDVTTEHKGHDAPEIG